MQVSYGRLTFPAGTCGVSRSISVLEETEGGIPILFEWKYDCTAYLTSTQTNYAAIQQDLSNQEQTIRSYLSIPNQFFGVYLDNGQLSDMSLNPAATLQGPLVKIFDNPIAGGAEYAAKRTIRFSVSAKVATAGSSNIYLSFHEAISATGNGAAKNEDAVTLDGLAVRMQITPISLCRAQQRGSLISFLRPVSHDDAPTPLWPNDLRGDESSIEIGSPIMMLNGYMKYPLSWSYTFVRGGEPFIGFPNRQM